MIYICLFSTAVIIVACILTGNVGRELYEKKEYKFGIGLAVWIENKYGISRRVGGILWEAMDNINNHEMIDVAMKKHTVKKIHLITITALVMSILGVMLCFNNKQQRSNLNSVTRPNPGDGDALITKTVVIGDDEEQDINFEVSERVPSEEEIEKNFEQARAYIDDNYLGENESADNVYLPLNLVTSVPQSNVSIEWITDEEGYIYSDGKLAKIEDEEGKIAVITAIIKYADCEERYSLSIRLVPIDKTSEKDVDKLVNVIEEEDARSKEDSILKLPDKLGDKDVSYIDGGGSGVLVLLMLGVVSAIIIVYMSDEEIKKKNLQRKEEMLIDFPEIMTKFGVYLRAGLTVSLAWGRIVDEYLSAKKEGGKDRFAYNEMVITWNEMKNGSSWIEAYEKFGKRCDVIQYGKFATWIIQNGQKGGSGLIELLETESYEAKEERNKIIRINGERISQKILVPMMGLLGVVMMIVMIPAFIGFM